MTTLEIDGPLQNKCASIVRKIGNDFAPLRPLRWARRSRSPESTSRRRLFERSEFLSHLFGTQAEGPVREWWKSPPAAFSAFGLTDLALFAPFALEGLNVRTSTPRPSRGLRPCWRTFSPFSEGPRTGKHGFGHFCRNKRDSSCGRGSPHFQFTTQPVTV